MNEKLNLVEILKDCPKGIKLYSPLFGEVEFDKIDLELTYQVVISISGHKESFNVEGRYLNGYPYSECLLFPSKDQRDWSKFKVKKPKFDPKTLQPFDKVLVKNDYNPTSIWYADFVSYRRDIDEVPVTMYDCMTPMVIPYNEETKHLCGTSNEAPEYYRYWEDNEEPTPKMSIK